MQNVQLGFEDFDVIPVTNLSVDDGYLFSFFIRYDLTVHECDILLSSYYATYIVHWKYSREHSRAPPCNRRKYPWSQIPSGIDGVTAIESKSSADNKHH